MITKNIYEFLTKDDITLREKIKELLRFTVYYHRLKKNLSSGCIYHTIKEQNRLLIDLIDSISPLDSELIDLLFKKDVERYLGKIQLNKSLNFIKKEGISQIGHNCIYIDKPISGLWTTGRATFYLPTRKQTINRIAIEFFSIPPLNIKIGFEDKQKKELTMHMLTTKKIEFMVEPLEVTKVVSEIFIETDRLWDPSILTLKKNSVNLGICVRSIQIFDS